MTQRLPIQVFWPGARSRASRSLSSIVLAATTVPMAPFREMPRRLLVDLFAIRTLPPLPAPMEIPLPGRVAGGDVPEEQ